jgi:hypothetical protein
LILAGIAVGAAIVAIASVQRRADVPEQAAVEIPSPPPAAASDRPSPPPPAPPMQPALSPRVAPEPPPPPAAAIVTAPSRAHDHRSHRHAIQPHFPPRNGAPIIE